MANNLFIQAKDMIQQNDTLNYINYQKISEGHKEFLRSDVWDFEFTKVADAVYFPGMDLLHARMMSVTPQFNVGLSQMQATIRQFTINQTALSGTTSGSLSMDFMDREDQAITVWLDDWRDKMGSREERYAFRKEHTYSDGKLTHMNSSRKPLRIFEIYTIQPTDVGGALNPSYGSDDPQNVGQISASFSFEHYKLLWKNI